MKFIVIVEFEVDDAASEQNAEDHLAGELWSARAEHALGYEWTITEVKKPALAEESE